MPSIKLRLWRGVDWAPRALPELAPDDLLPCTVRPDCTVLQLKQVISDAVGGWPVPDKLQLRLGDAVLADYAAAGAASTSTHRPRPTLLTECGVEDGSVLEYEFLLTEEEVSRLCSLPEEPAEAPAAAAPPRPEAAPPPPQHDHQRRQAEAEQDAAADTDGEEVSSDAVDEEEEEEEEALGLAAPGRGAIAGRRGSAAAPAAEAAASAPPREGGEAAAAAAPAAAAGGPAAGAGTPTGAGGGARAGRKRPTASAFEEEDTPRPAKSRKTNALGGRWTTEEVKRLIELMEQHGTCWSLIALGMPHRDQVAIKDKYRNLRNAYECGWHNMRVALSDDLKKRVEALCKD